MSTFLLVAVSHASAQEAWNDTDWTQYDTITINSSNIDDDLTDFPVFLDLSDLSDNFWNTTPSASTTVATDIRVTTGTSSPYEIPRELVYASSTLETGELHFKAPFISSSTNTVFRVYYNGTTTGDYASTSVNGSQAVWNDYDAVWHFDDDPGTEGLIDSTANMNNGTVEGGMDINSRVDGKLGRSYTFDETNDRIGVDDDDSLTLPDGDWSYSMWVNLTDNTGSTFQYLSSWGPSSTNNALNLYFYEDAYGGGYSDKFNINTDTFHELSGAYGANHNWQKLHIQRSGTTVTTYVNGVADATTISLSSAIDNSESFYIGGRNDADTDRFYGGEIDNMRLQDRALSEAWIVAEYTNQSTTTDFYSVRSSGAQVWNSTDWTQYDTITIDSVNIDDDLTDFPVYVDMSDLSSVFWATTPTGSELVGTDIRVTTGTSSPYEIPRELVFASSTLKTGELHFKAPFISSTTDTSFRIYYNGTTTGDYYPISDNGSHAVWSDYDAVWHFDDDPEQYGLIDSTANGNDGTVEGNMNINSRVDGKLGRSFTFDEINDRIAVPDDESLTLPNGDWSYSVWVDLTDNAGSNFQYFTSWGTAGGANTLNLYFNEESASNGNRLTVNRGTSNLLSGNYGANHNWQKLHIQRSGTTITSYIDGVADASTYSQSSEINQSSPFYIGGREDANSARFYGGEMDNMRLQDRALPEAWIVAEHLNQATPTDFYTATLVTDDVTVSGTLTDDGSPVTGANIKLAVSTSSLSIFATTTNASGEYSFVFDNQYMSTGNQFVLWVDGQTERASLVGKFGSPNGIIETDLVVDQISLRQEGDNGLTLGDIATYDSTDDSDIEFIADTSSDSLEILNNQTLYIDSVTELELPASTTLSGSLINNGSIVATSTGGNLYLSGTNATTTSVGATNLPDTIITGSHTMVGEVTVDSLTINSGASLTAPDSLTTKGDFINNGSFDANGGVLFSDATVSASLSGSLIGSNSLADLNVIGPATLTISDTASTSNITIGSDSTLVGPSTLLTVDGSLTNQGTFTENGGLMHLRGGGSYNIEDVLYNGELLDISNQSGSALGTSFNDDGTKVYVIDNSSRVIYAYDLSTAWDVSSATYNSESYSVVDQETRPDDLAFNDDGTKLYVISGWSGNQTIYAYDLSVPWDVSSASYDNQSFYVGNQAGPTTGISFKPDGTKVFIVGWFPDRVFAYDLGTAWDVSTAVYNDANLSVGLGADPSDLTFNSDGTKMFVLAGDSFDTILVYDLSIPWDVSTGVYNDESYYVGSLDSGASNIAFNPDGSKLYVTGDSNNAIYTYDLPAVHSTNNSNLGDAEIDFYQNFGDATTFNDLTINSGSIFKAPITTLAISGSYTNNGTLSNNLGTTTFTGTTETIGGNLSATSSFYNLNIDGSYIMNDNASTTDLTINSGGSLTAPSLLSVKSAYTNNGSFDANGGTFYSTAETYKIEEAIYKGESFDVSSQEFYPDGLSFNSDGTKVYVISGFGNASDIITAYDLSTAWDVSTATYNGESFSVSSQETAPRDIIFNDDGTKAYIVGSNSNTIYAYNLSTSWDVSTATYDSESVSVSGQDSSSRGIAFNADGTKIYMVGAGNDNVYAYNLSNPWDVSTSTYDSESVSVGGQDGAPQDIVFDTTGTKMFVLGDVNDTVFVYNLSTPWDVSTATYDSESVSLGGQDGALQGLALNTIGTKIYVVGEDTDTIYAYDLELPIIHAGNLTNTNAYHDLEIIGDVPVTFTSKASTTGTFSHQTGKEGVITFNAGDSYTFENINWQGGGVGDTLILQSSVPGTQWQLDVVGNAYNTDYLSVQDSSSASTIFAYNSVNLGNNTNWSFVGEPVAWNNTDWSKYDTITIDSTNIDEDLTDFPVYVNLSDLSSRFWDTTPADSLRAGTDIRVTTGTSSPYELPRQIVFASSTLQTGKLYFKAPSISSTTDTVFRIYYNGTTTGDYDVDSAYGRDNVWTDYSGVFFAENGGVDSTGKTDNVITGSNLETLSSLLESGDFGRTITVDFTPEDFTGYDTSFQVIAKTTPGGHQYELAYDRFSSYRTWKGVLRGNYGTTIETKSSITYSSDTDFDERHLLSFGAKPSAGLKVKLTRGETSESIQKTTATTENWAAGSSIGIGRTGWNYSSFKMRSDFSSDAWINAEHDNLKDTSAFYTTELVTIIGSTTITNHDATQVNNNFNFMNKTDESLFAFKLEPVTGASTITELVVSLSGIREINVNDFSNIRLVKDHDNDAEYDAGDELVSNGTMSINENAGTITFGTDFNSTSTTNYLIVADWNYPSDNSSINLDLYEENITAVDGNGTHVFLGEVSRAQHSRLAKRLGGGGSASAVGTPAPSGRSTTTGGTNEGGEQIGDEVGFRWPTAHTGVWTNEGNAYDKVDGTYATTDTDSATTSYQNHLFNIPSGNTISGIEVRSEMSREWVGDGPPPLMPPDFENVEVDLSYDGGLSWTSSKGHQVSNLMDSVFTSGGLSDLWGRSWNPSEFSDDNFQIRLTANTSEDVVIKLDAIQVRVYHQSTGGSSGGGGAI